MRHLKSRRLCLLLLSLIITLSASAYDFEVDGIYYNIIDSASKEVEVTYGDNPYSGNVIIQDSITYINYDYIVTKIGYGAFYYSESLTSISIPNSIATIGGLAFYRCSSLTTVTIPNSINEIGYDAFRDCNLKIAYWMRHTPPIGYENISAEIHYVPNESFNFSDKIIYYDIFINNGITYILNSDNTCSLAVCSHYANDSITIIPERIVYNGENLTVNCIESYAFSSSSTVSVSIPNSVTKICENAFYNCTSLTSIMIPNSVVEIGEWAFFGCKSLLSVIIPNRITKIANYTFGNCHSLTSVTIPNSVTKIDVWAFSKCRLSKVYWLGNTPPSGCENVSAKSIM